MKKTIGKAILDSRKLKGWTQVQLAEKLGVAQSTVVSWEVGTRNISLSNLERVGKVLDIEFEFLQPQSIQINPYDDDFGAVCNCAVRYAIGRATYMPSIVVGFIKPILPKLNNRTLWCLERDIEDANSYGDPEIDKPLWMDLLKSIRDENKKRSNDNGSND